MADLLPVLKQRFYDSNGDPLAGGKLYSYEAGTVTPKATYTTAAGDVANANPVVLDANGECSVYISAENYKFVLTDSSDVTQWTVDNATLPSVAALASAFYRRQVNLTSASSPYTMDEDDNGTLFNVNSSGGAVVINAPEISSVDLPFNFAVILETAGNNCTINRAGTDTIAGATSKVLSSAGVGVQLIGDDQASPDKWSVLDFGTVADGGITNAKLNASAITGQTNDSLPDMAADYILTYDASATSLKKSLLRNVVNKKIQSQTTGYTAAVTDGLAVCSGASFTIDLPAAASLTGTVLEFLHNGTSLTQVYTLDGNSSETIGGSTTYGLYTNGEYLKIMSDGTNWLVLEHRAETGLVSAGALTIGAVSSAPTKGTMTVDTVYWSRKGKYARVFYSYHQSAAGSGAAGSGDYLVTIPLTVDTTNFAVNSGAFTTNTASAVLGQVPGYFKLSGSAGTAHSAPHLYSSTQFRLFFLRWDAASVPIWGSSFGALNGAIVTVYGWLEVPIDGWQP